VDTNCDPDEVDYIIPGNDDAIRAVKTAHQHYASAVVEAKEEVPVLRDDQGENRHGCKRTGQCG